MGLGGEPPPPEIVYNFYRLGFPVFEIHLLLQCCLPSRQQQGKAFRRRCCCFTFLPTKVPRDLGPQQDAHPAVMSGNLQGQAGPTLLQQLLHFIWFRVGDGSPRQSLPPHNLLVLSEAHSTRCPSSPVTPAEMSPYRARALFTGWAFGQASDGFWRTGCVYSGGHYLGDNSWGGGTSLSANDNTEERTLLRLLVCSPRFLEMRCGLFLPPLGQR